MSEYSFGNSTEEVEGFLLALWAMKGGDGGDDRDRPTHAHYRENLRTW